MSYLLTSLHRDWRVARSHGPAVVIDLTAMVVSAVVFYYLARFVGRGDTYFLYALAGLIVLRVHAGIPRVVQATAGRLADGTLEVLLSGARRPSTVLVGEALFELLRGLVLGAGVLLVATVVLGTDVRWTTGGVATLIVGFLSAEVVLLGLAVALLSLLMVLREAGAVASLAGVLLPVLGGAYFPVSDLPGPLRTMAAVLPFHLPVDLLRRGLEGRSLDAGLLGQVVVVSVVSLLVAASLSAPAISWARRSGRLAHA